jgi:DNA repair exonuclease SbcCD ATPase subunit
MKILDVSWRNFNSYGNNTQTLTFNQSDGELNVLLGENGTGKTTIAEIITFALYGKVDGKKMSDLPNRINKELWVQINIICKQKKITIIRGISPGIFDVFIDGVSYDQAGKGNVQDYLETEFYDIPFQVFRNIIVLSIEDFKSFLTMSPGDKRNIIDRLFGFSIINQMKDSVRNERKQIKQSIRTYDDELNIISQAISSIDSKLLSLEAEQLKDSKGKIKELKEQAINLSADKKTTAASLSKVKAKESELNLELNEVSVELNALNQKISQDQRTVNLYEKDCCPTCERGWDNQDISNKETLKDHIEMCGSKATELLVDIKSVKDKLQKLRNHETIYNNQVTTLTMSLNTLVTELKELSVETGSGEQFTHLKSLLEENNISQLKKTQEKSKQASEDQFLQMIEAILGDDGVKNLAVKTILPSLNASITKMAGQMHLPYSICFDEKFNCNISHIGNKISAKTLSSGQRKKTDFIIIIALIRLMKLRYPELNLLFLDELLSSVDSGGRHEILKILKETVKESQLNAWVINHSELPMELFDRRGEAYFDGGFSQLDIEHLN